ncbi:MAG: ABC transporter ATP-binding protein/permease [Chloroflexota bacterium]|nr:ABC transporter ATP-binding protein/permease [Chloroflexota bacterium]
MNGGWWSYIRYDEEQDRPSISRAVLRRVAGYARPYAWKIGLMLATILASTGLSLLPPLLIRALVDDALPNRDFTLLNLLAAGMVAVPILSGLIGVAQRYLSARVGEGIIYDLRRTLFGHLQRQSLRFFTNSKTGELMARVNNDVVGAQQAITSTMVNVISNAVSLVGTLAIMLALEWRLTVAAILILPLFVLPARRVGRLLRRITREGMALNAQMNGMMNETLNVSGALLVKLFGREGDESRRFAERALAVRDVGIRQALIGRWFFLGLSLTSAIGTAVVFWAGGYLVLTDALTIGTVVAFGAYLTQLYGPLSALTNARVELATSLVSFERVFEVLDLPVEIRDRPGALELRRVRGEVRFENVSFDYNAAAPTLSDVVRWGSRDPSLAFVGRNGRKGGKNGASGLDARGSLVGPQPVLTPDTTEAGEDEAQAGTAPARRWALRDIDVTIQPGQLVALVGPSGAGKTTLTYLLPRLYDPTEGRVLIDGHDLRDITLHSLVRQIGMVTQETHLFHDTIRANLLYAREDATDAEIESACKAAYIHDFIAGLPDGYDTVVGERGYRLSGGEKQRIAIARILLKDPRILILDEATAHLDSESEAQIQAALERAMEGRTSLVIAHRLSTILAADLILVMEGGRLVERGIHAELLASGGLYARLYRTQFRAAASRVDSSAPAATGT